MPGSCVKVLLLLIPTASCVFSYCLFRQIDLFPAFNEIGLSLQLVFVFVLTALLSAVLLLTFRWTDLLISGVMLSGFIAHPICTAAPWNDCAIFLFSLTLGKAVKFLFKWDLVRSSRKMRAYAVPLTGQMTETKQFLLGLVGFLAFSVFWRLETATRFYPGVRWTGLWSNPNTYGSLMGVGALLAIGLLAARQRAGNRAQEQVVGSQGMEDGLGTVGQAYLLSGEHVSTSLGMAAPAAPPRAVDTLALRLFLLMAALMMMLGLLCSYSRGAWLATAIGLLYLANKDRKCNWRYVFPGILIVVTVLCFYWSGTPDTAPWYVKRLDLGRPSAQHRVAAWEAGLRILWDHPFGVGWNKTVEVYEKDYSPPEGSATAITTNDYLMIGTQLGVPGLICFVTYVGLCLKGESRKQKAETSRRAEGDEDGGVKVEAGGMDGCPPSPKSSPPGRGLSGSPRFLKWARFGFMRRQQKSQFGNCRLEISESDGLQVACRAGALALAVAFWFDGGLFTLATAAVFWVLLELGQVRSEELNRSRPRKRSVENPKGVKP